MARRVRNSVLEARSNRLKQPVAKKPVFVRIGPGLSLGYRRNQTAGNSGSSGLRMGMAALGQRPLVLLTTMMMRTASNPRTSGKLRSEPKLTHAAKA